MTDTYPYTWVFYKQQAIFGKYNKVYAPVLPNKAILSIFKCMMLIMENECPFLCIQLQCEPGYNVSLTFSVDVLCNILYSLVTTEVGAVPYLFNIVLINQHIITATGA